MASVLKVGRLFVCPSHEPQCSSWFKFAKMIGEHQHPRRTRSIVIGTRRSDKAVIVTTDDDDLFGSGFAFYFGLDVKAIQISDLKRLPRGCVAEFGQLAFDVVRSLAEIVILTEIPFSNRFRKMNDVRLQLFLNRNFLVLFAGIFRLRVFVKGRF